VFHYFVSQLVWQTCVSLAVLWHYGWKCGFQSVFLQVRSCSAALLYLNSLRCSSVLKFHTTLFFIFLHASLFRIVFFGHTVVISNIQNTFDKKRYEMKLGLQNYAIIIPTESSYFIVHSNKINSLQKVWHCTKLQISTQSHSVFVPT
jgi:hypothetical protein